MKVLIDTHTFLWIAAEPEKLSHRARVVCSAEALFLSVASVWEISIKSHIGRLTLPGSARRLPCEADQVCRYIPPADSVQACGGRRGTFVRAQRSLRPHACGAVPQGTPALRDEGPVLCGVRRRDYLVAALCYYLTVAILASAGQPGSRAGSRASPRNPPFRGLSLRTVISPNG